MSKRKKVKFADSANHTKRNCKDVPSLMHHSFDCGKTIEYKYFRKLQEKTSRKRQVSQVPMQVDHVKESKARDNMEGQNSVASKSYIPRSLSVDYIVPVTERFPISRSKASEDYGEYLNEKSRLHLHGVLNCKGKKCDIGTLLFPLSNVTPVAQRSSSSPFKDPWSCAPKHGIGHVFSEKRTKLLHLVAQSFSLGMDELILNRSDIIFELRQRLGVATKSKELEEFFMPRKEVSNGSCRSPTLSNLSFFERFNDSEGTDLVETVTRRQFCNYGGCKEADDPASLPWHLNEVQPLPICQALEDCLFSKKIKNSWRLDKKKCLDVHADKTSTSFVHQMHYSGHNEDAPDEMDFISSECLLPTNSSYYSTDRSLVPYFSDRSVVPYTRSTSLELSDPTNHGWHCMFQLPGFDNHIKEEDDTRVASYSLVPLERDNLSSTLDATSNLMRQEGKHGRPDAFCSPFIRNYQMTFQGASNHHHVLSPKPRHDFELELNTLPISLTWNQLSSNHGDRRLLEEKIGSKLDFFSSISKYNGGIDTGISWGADIIQATYSSSPLFGLCGFKLDG